VRDDRTLLDVVNDIFGNIEDIIRAEIRLAKAEVSEELRGAKASAFGAGIALLASAFTALFLLLSAMYALSLVIPTWGAALCIALLTAALSLIAFLVARRRSRGRQNIAPKIAASVKENSQWAKQSIK
jgi:pilus assembly protein TadC